MSGAIASVTLRATVGGVVSGAAAGGGSGGGGEGRRGDGRGGDGAGRAGELDGGGEVGGGSIEGDCTLDACRHGGPGCMLPQSPGTGPRQSRGSHLMRTAI